jgi:sugar transferase (PEP-CTERM/EpsH1 system associated)
MIRIMHVVNNLGKGGLENGLVNLIERMDSHRFEHVVCTIRSMGPNAARLPADRTRLISLGERGAGSRLQMPALVKTIRRWRPHVVHSRNWGAIEGVLAGRLATGCAVVHSEHGFDTATGAVEPRRRAWFRRVAFELADRVLSVSFQLKELHAGRTGFRPDRITVIHNGVDGARFFPDPETRGRVRDEFGLAESDFCIGCVANLHPVKDHMTLLRSVAALAPGAGNWRLLLIGEGVERPRLEAFVDAEPALKKRVTFLGLSSRVPELLRGMDAFVLPSLAEGINNSVLEAMSSGLAVVATAVGGNPEIVVDGDSGFLVPAGDVRALADRLQRLYVDRPLRIELGRRAIKRSRDEFSIESMVHAYEGLYLSLGTRAAANVPAVSAG